MTKRPVASMRVREFSGTGRTQCSNLVDGVTTMMMTATINFHRAVEMLNPKIVSYSVRFITPDVALADGACVYQEEGGESKGRRCYL